MNAYLEGLRIDGCHVYCPQKLEPTTFTKHIKKPLENLGGKWKKELGCFVFPDDPSERIASLRQGKRVNLVRDYQYYDSPVELVGHLLMFAEEAGFAWRDLDLVQARVLEPSAGRGTIVKNLSACGFRNIHYYELMPENRLILQREITRLNIATRYCGEDFLAGTAGDFDLVVANPPFRADVKHIKQMIQVTREGGFVFTIASEGIADKAKFMEFLGQACVYEMRKVESDPEDPLFEGTHTGCWLIVAQKKYKSSPSNKKVAADQLTLFS